VNHLFLRVVHTGGEDGKLLEATREYGLSTVAKPEDVIQSVAGAGPADFEKEPGRCKRIRRPITKVRTDSRLGRCFTVFNGGT
jgi:hypothetical protein